ncbi:MAG: putative transporter substrate binding protein, partial [Thermomicrobiales bacterium]|nr:putative transporter substrate binding protein [Thermomicrobiales bacterium]
TGIDAGKIPTLPILTEKRFDGQEVVVFSLSPPPISSPIQKFGPQWEAATGATINLVTFPFGEVYEKLRSGLATGGYTFDLVNFSASWAADIAGGGYLDPMPEEIQALVQVDDYYKTYRDAMYWGDTMYGLMYDGDAHNLWYRRDLFENEEYRQRFSDAYDYELRPPATWEQYQQIGEFFSSFDWSGTGQSYGAVEPMGRGVTGIYYLLDRGVSYAKTEGDPYVFFDPDGMRPRINEPGWVQALTDWVTAAESGIGLPGAARLGFAEVRPAFIGGQAAMCLEWGDIATLSYDAAQSKIKGKLGTALLPGASRVFDRVTQEWIETPEGNRAPYLAFTGWLFGVPTTAQAKEAAWDLAAFLCNPVASSVEVVLPGSGIQPSRLSTINDPDYLIAAGMAPEDARGYLHALGETIGHPNAVLDLRIPGTAEYYERLEVEASRAMAAEISPQEAMDNAAAHWEEITERLGREQQQQAYIESLQG